MPMTLEEAKKALEGTTRGELRDHAFGDSEITWEKDGKIVAEGFYGGGQQDSVIFPDYNNPDENADWLGSFDGPEARELRKSGTLGRVERNDETGPDTYSEGTCLPGLTLEGVRKELTGK